MTGRLIAPLLPYLGEMSSPPAPRAAADFHVDRKSVV